MFLPHIRQSEEGAFNTKHSCVRHELEGADKQATIMPELQAGLQATPT